MSALPILTVMKDGETLKSQPIEGEVLLGRGEGCLIRLKDRAISRQHAVFRPTADGVQVEKRSEFAPLSVNGAECTRAVLKEGDVVSIGPYLLRLAMQKRKAKEEETKTAILLPAEQEPEVLVHSQPQEPLLIQQHEQHEAKLLEQPQEQEEQVPSTEDGIIEPHATPEIPAIDSGGDSIEPIAGLEQLNLAVARDGPLELEVSGDSPSLLLETPEAEPLPDEEGKTRVEPFEKLNVKLIFKPGDANVSEYEPSKDEVIMGRGKDCDIVLNDKKASRKHAALVRSGIKFLIRDLSSANGTFVNGKQIKERELAGEDEIRIGAVKFSFKALSAEYMQRAKDFESPVEQSVEEDSIPAMISPVSLPGAQTNSNVQTESLSDLVGVPGITGISGPAKKKNLSLMEKFRALPKNKQIIYGLVGLALFYFLFIEEDEPVVQKKKAAPAKQPVATASVTPSSSIPAPMTYESLTPEQKKFVEVHHALAFQQFTGKDYDRALDEIAKVFQYVAEYKDSREIKRFALEGKRKMEALAEEKRRREEEAARKAKIEQAVAEVSSLMSKKKYTLAKEKFADVMTLDPDNTQVGEWKREIETWEEEKRRKEQERQVQLEINKRAWEIYREGLVLKKHGKCHSAIDVFGKVGDIGASDKRPAVRARSMIQACKTFIREQREPVLAEAKGLEESGELAKAFPLYKKATRIDPPHPEGYAGMRRIRGVLHARAKAIYTEAVLAESYSDFALAKSKFKECLQVAPEDDIYYERAQRKLKHYFTGKEEADSP